MTVLPATIWDWDDCDVMHFIFFQCVFIHLSGVFDVYYDL